MDFSPLKMETPSAHSSPHRTPMKPSPMCSPHVEPLEPSSYTNVGFSRGAGGFCGTGARPLYPVVRDDLDANTEKSSPRLPSSSPQTPSLASDLSRAYSPVIANFLTEEADGSSAGNPITATRSSPFPDQAKFPDNQKTHGYADRCRDVTEISDHVSTAPRDHTGAESAQRSPKNQSGVCDEEEEEVDCDDNVVEIKDDGDESESEKDDEQEEEDEDQIECAECGTVFSNLQLYMDHTCYRSHVTAKGLTETASRHQPRPHHFLHNESPISDAEVFKGKIVYNPNGSAYIIEGSSLDSDLDLPLLPDSIIVKEGQSVLSVERSIPKIANAVFFSKPDAGHGSSRAPCDPEPADKPSPAMHSYNVYDLRHSEIDDLLQRFPACKSQRHHVKPILMCFICKLSFGNPKSFLRHCMYDHAMSLHEDEKTLLCRPTASALIHTYGKEKQPTISVLQPIPGFDSRTSELRKDPFFSPAPESMKPTNNNNFLDSRKSSMEERNSCAPHVRDSKTTKENSPGADLQDTEHKEDSGIFQRSTAHLGAHHSHKMDNFLTTSQVSGSDFLPSNHFLYTSQGSVMDQPSMRQRSSPSVLPSPQGNSGSPSGSDSFYQSSSTPSTSLPNLLLPSSTSSGMHFAMSSTSNALQSLGLNMPSFFGSCDEHPQGRAQGVECPKCDMVLSSTQSLGGHMTMTHSRNSCKTLKCPKCNWHYKYQETLEIHMKEKHPDSDAQCVYCLTNQSHPRLARGESYSCGYKPYRCEVCNYSTTTKGNLSIHMQSDKHINNMQDLANGGTEMKMQPPPSPAPQALPPTASTPAPHNSSPYPQEESQYKKLKQKQSFRCDVCSYETSVARNLRIHMTSEKHTHNMLVMSQSISHLHQDMTLHQINQMNKLLALNQQEQAARFAALSPHLPGNMFSYEQTAMLMSASANPAPSGNYEIPMNLTKENGIDDSLGHISNKDATKMFQCCICNKYGSDSVENVHNHIQYDRTKAVPADAHVTFSNGAYHCNLCTYKTHLKANFQLHCKTDKHLQKLQLVNHIQEGGAENEWRLTVSGSPMQISCNACSFFANSTHKMQLHLSTLQHESCAQLFRHLQLLDHATPASPPGKLRYYHCTLCAANVHTKQRLILHSRSPHHVRKEQALPQGRLSIFDVFLIKEISEGATVEFEDAG
ncbi:zinc finger homeobox protein 4-like [Physella acuta]|uniref:zinc finger homeobox protein 4-like n=1 Tax=Physella acuta TaxID=109671 RepID=UPI0027DE899A|nr:zinc finger homeobox protein 4-like [Physella acuta]